MVAGRRKSAAPLISDVECLLFGDLKDRNGSNPVRRDQSFYHGSQPQAEVQFGDAHYQVTFLELKRSCRGCQNKEMPPGENIDCDYSRLSGSLQPRHINFQCCQLFT